MLILLFCSVLHNCNEKKKQQQTNKTKTKNKQLNQTLFREIMTSSQSL